MNEKDISSCLLIIIGIIIIFVGYSLLYYYLDGKYYFVY